MKKLLALALTLLFSGCATVGQQVLDLNATYSNAKRTYVDSKHILYEIRDDVQAESEVGKEVEFWRNEHKEIKEAL